jgi:NADH-quinone oxidoreductase subunit L
MQALLWLAVALPAAGALAVRFAPAGDRALTVLGGLVAAVPAWVLLVLAAQRETARTGFAWLPGADGLDVGLRLDPLAAVMSALVATIGLVVVVYSTGYFAAEPRRRSAFAGLLGFLAAMQGLVLADGYLALLFFWELVGVASARLIAFNRDDPGAAPGAVRAFLTTRTADLGLYLAALALFTATGTLAFAESRPAGALGTVVGLGLVVAAMGKSAQVPLQTWLTGAMAGPTPVSALLHSATMVAAGVYLLMRSASLLAGWPLELAGWVGALTAVAGAVIALGQDDLKRVLAGSTTSQLGLMFVGVAAGGPVVGLFHLIAHAAGKAAMFLAAGLFQHERGGTSLRALRGVGRDERAGFACFVAGALSIAAVPPFAAFWSKDTIAAAAESHPAWFVLVLAAAAGSAAYLLRPALVLWRPADGPSPTRPAPGRGAMLAGAGVLGLASVVLGAAGRPLVDLVGGELPSSARGLALSLAAVVVGGGAVVLVRRVPAPLAEGARRELFVNEALRMLVQRPVLALARMMNVADRRVVDAAVDAAARATLQVSSATDQLERSGIDAAVDGLARSVGLAGERARRLQTGRLYEYLRDSALGVVAVGALIALAAVL